jgi:hypothetical protein
MILIERRSIAEAVAEATGAVADVAELIPGPSGAATLYAGGAVPGVRVREMDDELVVEIHVALRSGDIRPAAERIRRVARQSLESFSRLTGGRPVRIDVFVDDIRLEGVLLASSPPPVWRVGVG